MILILTNKKTIKPKAKKFFQLLGNNLSKNGSDFSIASFQDIEIFISGRNTEISVSGKPLNTWSTIFPRKVGHYSGLAFIIAKYAKQHRLTFIDRFRESTNDLTKLVQMFLFSSKNILIPKTYHSPSYDRKHINNAIQFLGFPIVIKQCNTSKGSGVKLAKNKTELIREINSFIKEDPLKEIILQEYIENTFEYRILVTGTTISIAEKKKRSSKEEFRNNVHLGASEEFFDPKDLKISVAKTAIKTAKVLNIQVAGVDITEDKNGRPVVFEVNSCPAFTLDERVSDEVKKLAEYLTLCERK